MSSSSIAIVFLSFALAASIFLVVADPVSRWLVAWRARRLPQRLEQRLREEWLAEVTHLRTPIGKLLFALRLFGTRTSSLASAMDACDAPEGLTGAVVLSDDRILVAPSDGEIQVAGTIDLVIVIALILGGYAALSDGMFRSLWMSFIGALALWHLVAACSICLLGATPGELIVGLRRVTLDRTPLTWRCVARLFGLSYVAHVASSVVVVSVGLVIAGAPLSTLTVGEAAAVLGRWQFGLSLLVLHALLFIMSSIRASKGSADSRRSDPEPSEMILVYRTRTVTGVPEDTSRGSTSAMR